MVPQRARRIISEGPSRMECSPDFGQAEGEVFAFGVGDVDKCCRCLKPPPGVRGCFALKPSRRGAPC